jgi:hypothetical protein
MSVHVELPAGADWKRSDAMPDPVSLAPPVSVLLPRSGEPGSVTLTAVGGVPSARAATVSGLSALSTGAPPARVMMARTT